MILHLLVPALPAAGWWQRGRVLAAEASTEAQLLRCFGHAGTSASAPLAALARHGSADDAAQGYWMWASPLHIQAGLSAIRTLGPGHIGLDEQEARTLAGLLSAAPAAGGARVHAHPPQGWLLRLDTAPALATTPLPELAARDMEAALPTGEHAGPWRRWMTELQMELHQHPVNAARETSGRLPVNAVWLWGGGRLPAPAGCALQRCAGPGPLLAGLARLAGIEPVLDSGSSDDLRALHGHTALALVEAAGQDRWLHQAGAGLARGKWREVCVYDAAGRGWQLRRWHLLRRWRQQRGGGGQ